MRVIASSIRKGNIIEREDGQLCVVLSAESFHPGKGTPTTQIDMRRLSDGVKVTAFDHSAGAIRATLVRSKSEGDGSYVAPGLSVGTYSVTVAKAGFDSFTAKGVTLHPAVTSTAGLSDWGQPRCACSC